MFDRALAALPGSPEGSTGLSARSREEGAAGPRWQPARLAVTSAAYLRLNRLDEAIADYDALLKIDAKMAHSLYGRGLAKLKKGNRDGGEADIAAAKAIKAEIADEFAKWVVH